MVTNIPSFTCMKPSHLHQETIIGGRYLRCAGNGGISWDILIPYFQIWALSHQVHYTLVLIYSKYTVSTKNTHQSFKGRGWICHEGIRHGCHHHRRHRRPWRYTGGLPCCRRCQGGTRGDGLSDRPSSKINGMGLEPIHFVVAFHFCVCCFLAADCSFLICLSFILVVMVIVVMYNEYALYALYRY